jgi:hypothetical protein
MSIYEIDRNGEPYEIDADSPEDAANKAKTAFPDMAPAQPAEQEQPAAEPTATEAIFPRASTVENPQTRKEFEQRNDQGVVDALSLAGRGLASLPALMPGGETYGQALARPNALPRKGFLGKIAEFGGNILRSPMTPLMAIGGGMAAPVAKTVTGAIARPVLGKLTGMAVEGAGQGAGGYVGGAAERSAAGQPMTLGGEAKQAAVDVGLGAATNAGLVALGKLGKFLPKKAELPPTTKNIESIVPDISNAHKSVIIPDIDKEAENTLANTFKSAKEIKKSIPQAPEAGFMARVSPAERNMLAEKITDKDTPFTEYALQARKAISNMRESTPLDMAGAKGVAALKQVSEIKDNIGKQMGNMVDKLQRQQLDDGIFLDSRPIKQEWQKATSKYLGGAFDKSGNLLSTEGRGITDPAEKGLFKQINDYVSGMPELETIREMADAKTAIRRMVDNYKASMAMPINSTAEAAGKQVNGLIDNSITKFAGQEYKNLSQNYANAANIQSQLSRRLGEITDKETGQARMGASLMKSAIQSNSDRGTKALFNGVRKLTGIDLVKDAGYAKIAMDAVGDTRASDLLKDVGAIKAALGGGMVEKALKVGEMGLNKIRGDKLDDLINFYNKQQKRSNRLGKLSKK